MKDKGLRRLLLAIVIIALAVFAVIQMSNAQAERDRVVNENIEACLRRAEAYGTNPEVCFE